MTRALISFVDLTPGEDGATVSLAVERVIRSGWFVLGPEVEGFETEFARMSGASHSVGVGNGTDAIMLILRALGIGRGDEVITSPLSAAFSALAIVAAGARPVFADIDPLRLTIEPSAVADAITARTAAILPVHLYGQAADMAALSALATQRNLAIVEDCCQAHLATCGGLPVGTMSAAGAFSFYPTKNLGALGDGGAVLTNDAALAERVKRLRNGGQTTRYHHLESGVNSRLDEMQAAILRARLPFLTAWTKTRRALATTYREQLAGVDLEVPPEVDPGHVYHLFPILTGSRSLLQQRLAASGIETLVHYPVPITRQDAMQQEQPAICPVADRVCREVLSLPLHPRMTPEQVALVSHAVRDALRGAGD